MFDILFKRRKSSTLSTQDIAKRLYACALVNAREKIFYTQYRVPDTFEGRFDLLVLHIYIMLHSMMKHEKHSALSQALFDVTFKDMDQTLRELGIGDMGIPKHMKRMMKAFNGRMYQYQMAIAPESLEGQKIEGLHKNTLSEALALNIYGVTALNNVENQDALQGLCAFVEYNIFENESLSPDSVIKGSVAFENEISKKEEGKKNVG